MLIDASNPFLSYKTAILFALGCKGSGRPVFKDRGFNQLTFADEKEDYVFTFNDLNFDYISHLPIEDISAFEEEDYGKFFYTYGSAVLGNLMIAITKADWNSVDYNYDGVATYVGNYYNALITMDNLLEKVIEKFKTDFCDESSYSRFEFDYLVASRLIKAQKTKNAESKKSQDMLNSEIFYCAYIGLLFILYGYFITINKASTDKNLSSFFKSAKSKSSAINVVEGVLTNESIDTEAKGRMITLMYVFYKTVKFYKATSGFKELEALAGTFFDLIEEVMANYEKESTAEIRAALDQDLLDESFVNGITFQTFTDLYDLLNNALYFKSATILDKDVPNMFVFGRVYLSSFAPYVDKTDLSSTKLSDECKPPIRSYLDECLKDRYSNEEIERAFGIIKSIITGIDTSDLGTVNPGTILFFVLISSAFRILIERQTERSQKVKEELNGGIDILDMLILKIYDMWFNSNKFFMQIVRPNYCGDDGARKTLLCLKSEINEIIFDYLTFVRFGNSKEVYESDKNLWGAVFENQVMVQENNGSEENINKFFVNTSKDDYIRLCASKNGRSIVQSALVGSGNEIAFGKLVSSYAKTDIPKYVTKNLSIEPDNYTGISIVDRVIALSNGEYKSPSGNENVYALAVFASYWIIVEKLLKEHNVGNYFDFGNAENSLISYTIEKIYKEKIANAVKAEITLNSL